MSPSTFSSLGEEERESCVYLLNCSVCEGKFSCRENWMEHLTLDGHQNLARDCLLKDVNNLRECSLVIFTTYDLTAEWAVKIIQYFGRDQTVWVTDFLWWEDRPRFAVIQFESRMKVKQVLREVESFSGDTIEIKTQVIKLKGAFDLVDLEWKALLPVSYPAPIIPLRPLKKSARKKEARNDQLSNSTSEESMGEPTGVNSGEEDDKEDDLIDYVKLLFDLADERLWELPKFKFEREISPTNKTKYICTILLNGQRYKSNRIKCRAKTSTHAKKLAAQYCLEKLQNDDGISRKRRMVTPEDLQDNGGPSNCKMIKIDKEPLPGPALITFDLEKSSSYFNGKGDKKFLAYQLYSLLEESVVIPDKQFDKVLQAVNFLQTVFFHSYGPTCKVSLFRNWKLKLRRLEENAEDLPILYVCCRKPCSEIDSDFTLLSFEQVWLTLKSSEVKKKISVLDGPISEDQDTSGSKKGWTLECKGFGGDDEETVKLFLVSSHKFLSEVEFCGLLEYMCKFDGRAYQLIRLAYLWMGLNGLTLGVEEDSGLPSTLQWLVIFWMCHRGMVPSPREIQARRNHKVMRDGGTGVDLGWEEDKKWVEEWRKNKKGMGEFKWREDCVIGLLERFKEFLGFCGWLWEGGSGSKHGERLILNTRNGELIEMKDVLNSGDSNENGGWKINMSEEEVSLLRAQLVYFKECKGRIYMTNPLNMQWRFGLGNGFGTVLRLMRMGGNRLRYYLNVRKTNGDRVTSKIIGSLRNVLTLTDADFKKVNYNQNKSVS